MKKFLFVMLLIAMVGLVGCNNGGSSTPSVTTPAWAATIQTVNPVAAYAENGDFVGYVVGTDMVYGTVTVFNPEMGKFLEFLFEGSLRNFRNGVIHTTQTGPITNDPLFTDPHFEQAEPAYAFERFGYSVYRNDHSNLLPLVEGAEFVTVDRNDCVVYKDLTYSLSDREISDGTNEKRAWAAYEANSPYWANFPDYPFCKFIAYDEPFPFQYPTGKLTYDIKVNDVEEGSD